MPKLSNTRVSRAPPFSSSLACPLPPPCSRSLGHARQARAKLDISKKLIIEGAASSESAAYAPTPSGTSSSDSLLRTQAMARHLNNIEFAWSSERRSDGTIAGVWQLLKGEQRALGELLEDESTGRCISYVRFKQMLIEGAPTFATRICCTPPDWRDYQLVHGTTLADSPLRHEVHKLLRHLRAAADTRVLSTAARCRLIGVQRSMVSMLDHLVRARERLLF